MPQIFVPFFLFFLDHVLSLFLNFLVVFTHKAVTGFYEGCFGGQVIFGTFIMIEAGSSTVSFPEKVGALLKANIYKT